MKTLTIVLCLLTLLYSSQTQARTTLTVSYPVTDVWPTAVRFLRVDRGFPIREKDDLAGYILFDFKEGARLYKGSLEFIHTTDSQGRSATRIALSIPDLPRHFEQILLDKLASKIRDDRGYPAPLPAKTPPPSRDAG